GSWPSSPGSAPRPPCPEPVRLRSRCPPRACSQSPRPVSSSATSGVAPSWLLPPSLLVARFVRIEGRHQEPRLLQCRRAGRQRRFTVQPRVVPPLPVRLGDQLFGDFPAIKTREMEADCGSLLRLQMVP